MHHHRHPYAHMVQRDAAPQDIPITKSLPNASNRATTTVNRAARPTSDSDSNGNGKGSATRASATGILLGDPVFATAQPSPSPSQQSSNNNNNNNSNDDTDNSSPSPTSQSPVVVATSSTRPQTTLATSTVSPTDFESDPTSSTSSTYGGSRSGGSTTSSVAGSSTSGASVSSSGSSDGMSTGAKIGLAVGIVGIIGAFALFLMLFMAKKRKQREAKEKAEDEKRSAENQAAANAAAAKQRNAVPTPRLSLRPMSRLVPDLMGGNRPKNRSSQGNMLTTFSESRGDRSLSPSGNVQASNPRENPFNDPVNPFNDPEKVAAAAGGAAAYQYPRGQAHELEDTRSLGSSSRPGTAHSQFPGAPAPAVATGPGPDQNAQGNVYRIMMEFKPTMEDELELRAGQHVRMLHEYDDGWALCIRLDRSQQGVVPRTCLAAKPSKPRPAPGPSGQRGSPGPQSRPITPSSQGGPRMNSPPGPGGYRPESPANRPQTSGSGAPRHDPSSAQGSFNQAPRPLSPGPRPQMRSESPGPYGAGGPPPMQGPSQRQRSNSASNGNNRGPRNSPPGPSNLGPGMTSGPGFAF